MKKDTLIIKSCRAKEDDSFGAVGASLCHSSTTVFSTLKQYKESKTSKQSNNYVMGSKIHHDCGYYSFVNQTVRNAQNAISLLEADFSGQETNEDIKILVQNNKFSTLIFPSGLLAITITIMTLCKNGDHVLIPDNVYSSVRRFAENNFLNYMVEFDVYDPVLGIQDIQKKVRKNTKLILMEVPGSITFEILDLAPVVEFAKEHNIVTLMDNTWATPIHFQPLKWGIDISVNALGKYMNGHSDVLIGSITSTGKIFEKIHSAYQNFGIVASPDECYLLQRGLKTLNLRLNKHQTIALKVAKYLETVKEVKHVLYPALESFPQHQLWKKYFTGALGLITVILDKQYPVNKIYDMLDHMQIFSISESWGGLQSLVVEFDLSTVRTLTKDKYVGTCIRFYCGLEDVEDIIQDIERSFKRLRM